METQTRQQTERRNEERAAQQVAHVSVSIRGRELVVMNRGPADATDIHVTARPQEPAGIVELVFRSVQPIERLPAGSEIAFPLFTFDQAPDRYHVAAEWRHPAPTPGSWAGELSR